MKPWLNRSAWRCSCARALSSVDLRPGAPPARPPAPAPRAAGAAAPAPARPPASAWRRGGARLERSSSTSIWPADDRLPLGDRDALDDADDLRADRHPMRRLDVAAGDHRLDEVALDDRSHRHFRAEQQPRPEPDAQRDDRACDDDGRAMRWSEASASRQRVRPRDHRAELCGGHPGAATFRRRAGRPATLPPGCGRPRGARFGRGHLGRLGSHQQHRHRRGADDLLGIAADEQALDAAPSMGADDDEVGVPELGLGVDDVADPPAEGLGEESVDGDAARFDARPGLGQDLRAGIDEHADDVAGGELEPGREDQARRRRE